MRILLLVALFSAAQPGITLPPPGSVPGDTTVADSTTAIPERPPVIKKNLDPKEQLRVGILTMSVVITVMVLSNNFNPD